MNIFFFRVNTARIVCTNWGNISARFVETKNFRDVSQNFSVLLGIFGGTSSSAKYHNLLLPFIHSGYLPVICLPLAGSSPSALPRTLDKTRHNQTYFSQYQRKCWVLPRIHKQLFLITFHCFFVNVLKLC